MKPLRRAAFLAVLFCLSGAAAFAQPVEGAAASAPQGPAAVLAPTPSSVALAIKTQLAQLAPVASQGPAALAGTLDAALASAQATPSQKLAARYVLSAFASPKALPMVQRLVLTAGVPGANVVSTGLAAMAAPYRRDAGLRQSLIRATVASGLPLHWDAMSPAQVKTSLDALFENAGAARAAAAAVDTRGPPETTAKISAPLEKAGESRPAPEDANLQRLKNNFLSERPEGEGNLPEEVREAIADPASEADVDLQEVDELEQAPQPARISPEHRALQEKLLAGPLEQPELKPDFVDVGMGPTGMMSMLAAIASGRTAVGVEMRGKPTRGVHQNIREEWFHMLALIDKMMVERYGEDGVPKLANGKPFKLADFFYNADRVGGSLDFPELYPVKDPELAQNVAGRLTRVMFEDARDATKQANGGKAKLYVLPPPAIPQRADPTKVTGDMKTVLDSPSVFQVALINYELMLRSYLKAMEIQDKRAGRKPRVKLYETHRVVQEDGDAIGYVDGGNGRRRIIIENVEESRDGSGKAERARKAGTIPIDLGTPVRFALTPGFGGGADAKSLGYKQEDVLYTDPTTGEQVAAKQNWISGEVTANIGGQLLRRVSNATDPKTGKREILRQIAVGHEKAPNVAWVLAQVPDFAALDPIAAGKVPAGTDPKSPEYRKAAQEVLRDYYIKQVSEIVHIPQAEIRKMRMFYGPNLFTLTERIGKNARVASNGNVAGDLMGNGHFLTSGGAMTGMIGHTRCFLEYWKNIAGGMPEAKASRILEAEIRNNSEAWLHVSAKEFFDLLPANFGEERAKAINVNSADISDAGANSHQAQAAGYGLSSILGQATWTESFRRLLAGEFGKAGVDFYVPGQEVDLTQAPDVTIERVKLKPH